MRHRRGPAAWRYAAVRPCHLRQRRHGPDGDWRDRRSQRLCAGRACAAGRMALRHHALRRCGGRLSKARLDRKRFCQDAPCRKAAVRRVGQRASICPNAADQSLPLPHGYGRIVGHRHAACPHEARPNGNGPHAGDHHAVYRNKAYRNKACLNAACRTGQHPNGTYRNGVRRSVAHPNADHSSGRVPTESPRRRRHPDLVCRAQGAAPYRHRSLCRRRLFHLDRGARDRLFAYRSGVWGRRVRPDGAVLIFSAVPTLNSFSWALALPIWEINQQQAERCRPGACPMGP